MAGVQNSLIFYVNGTKVVERHPDPSTTLLQYLRRHLKLTGTKNACNQGGCGACTVMLSWWDRHDHRIKHASVNSCLVLICHLHGYAVTTVEGVGNTQTGLHSIQGRLVDSYGMQCGFCTPGMVMSMYTLLQTHPTPSDETLEKVLEGNLCRCTGYRPILDAFRTFCKEDCQKKDKCFSQDIEDLCHITISEKSPVQKNEATQDGRPPFLQDYQSNKDLQTVVFQCGNWTWMSPVTLEEMLNMLDTHPESHLIAGATNLGPKLKSMGIAKGKLISCAHVQEMNIYKPSTEGIELGASLTLSNIEERLKDRAEALNGHKTRGHAVFALLDSLRWIASTQIRNMATLGGQIVIGDPRSDLCVVLAAIGATATVVSKAGKRKVKLDNNFFERKNKVLLSPSEVLVSVYVPFVKNTYTSYYKQSHRKGFDYAILNSCFSASLSDTGTINHLDLCFGCVLDTTKRFDAASATAIGRFPDAETLQIVSDGIIRELNENKPNGVISKYKQKLACGFLFKFWRELSNTLNENKLPEIKGIHWTPCQGTQIYEVPSQDQPAHDSVGRPVPLLTAPALVSGEAMFLDDMPRFENELYVELLLSTKPHAKIISIDKSRAMSVPAVVDFLDSSSVPGQNMWGLFVHDEPLFAEDEVHCVGQPIGAVLATSKQAAEAAVGLIDVTYKDLDPILTIEAAIEADSYFEHTSRPIDCGNPEEYFSTCDFVREGQVQSGYQEHFYFEPSGALVVPKNESGEMEIFTTSQAPTFCQTSASLLLGIPRNRIIVRQKRLGGGFGGREYRTPLMFGAAAVAAQKWRRPVRAIMERAVDFQITGKRHPFLSKYKVGFQRDGQLQALSIHFYVNAGYTLDVSSAILDNACFNVDAAYKTPILSVYGHVCKTNTPSNTSMRAFGAAEAVFVMEAVLSTMAETLGLDQEKVRQINMYREGSLTHYKRKLENCMLQRCWSECIKESNFYDRKKEVDIYNSGNRFKKRGIAVMPLKFGVGYPLRHQNQGAALVNIYLDGSVTLAHGGVEMGQGLHTKMIQVASRVLGVPMETIYISETGTNTVPNTTSTGASLSSDLYGAAILDACEKINKRLKPFKDLDPKGTWESWVNAAYMQRISLSATGIGRPGNQHWDFVKGEGNPMHYYTYGAACTEVEIDCITGDHQVLCTDIVMDIGNSLNPALDVGQVEGGFVQGYGWITMEELKVSEAGTFNARGPVDYKIPGVKNIPRQMKVKIMKDCPNKGTVYSSKGIGEPPLLLSISVYIAIKEAIRSVRNDAGLDGAFDLDIPLTPEKIRMACPLLIPPEPADQ